MKDQKNNIAIEVVGLSKKFTLGDDNQVFQFSKFFNSLTKISNNEKKEFYALNNLNFVISKGETVGVIGRNGAGKSTLLKILSNITEPTCGRAIINGTLASVLEVGMGFHPELTGRENVFLSGVMLGISKKLIKEKFDDIVSFAGLKNFIDTPVKHYSSGMFVRLAFSVVVNIDADIILFDEVLSLGDYSFQMKCYEKITKLANSNKTILLVSHNNNDILSLCSKVIYLDKGNLLDFGDTGVVMKYFEKSMMNSPQINENNFDDGEESQIFENVLCKEWEGIQDCPGDDKIRIKKVFVINESRRENCNIYTNDKFSVNFQFEKFYEDDYYDIGLIVSNMNHMILGNHLGNSITELSEYKGKGCYIAKIYVDENFFNDTIISIGFGIYRDYNTPQN